jgi:hypothetical protein
MKRLLIVLLILAFLVQCSNKNKELMKIIEDDKIPNEVAILEVTKKILGKEFKEVQVEKIEDGYKVFVEFGGTSALTFQKDENYEKEHKLRVAKYLIEILKYIEQRKVSILIVSLVKPFYIKDSETEKEIIQEFELFRSRVLLSELNKIEGWRDWNLDNWVIAGKQNDELLDNLNKVIKIWTVELNEFKRVNLN